VRDDRLPPEFDWNPDNDTDHSIVVRHQPAIAVDLNPHDELVIQQDQYDDSDDHFVFITKDNVLRVLERMLEAAGIEMATAGAEPLLLPPSKDKTAAERMRRYRNKHSNDDRNGVTEEPELRLVAAE
jgi:hypothetical protein